jgi:RimJ/RimL family protein N-acetyltransferase
MADLELRVYTDADLALTRALESDKVTMANLGGPAGEERIRRVHDKRLRGVADGDWYLTIVPAGSAEPVGIIAIWRSTVAGREFDEIGLMLLPGYHRQGIGVTAMRRVIEMARVERPDKRIEAFISVTNEAGNAGARTLGYRLAGECDLDYEGEPLRCNHWVLDL